MFRLTRQKLRDLWAFLLLMASAVILVLSVSVESHPDNVEYTAQRVSKVLSTRMALLDSCMTMAIESDHSTWMNLGDVPSDVVVYRYLDDTLQSWNNQFTLSNDDISSKVVFQRLSNLKDNIVSPLTEVTEEPTYVNYGPKWYIVKLIEEDNCKVIGGLEILNSLDDRSYNGANPRFRLGDDFSVQPLSYSDGSVVLLGEQPVFKLVEESMATMTSPFHTILVWIAYFMFVSALLMFLRSRRILKRFIPVVLGLVLSSVALYVHGTTVSNDARLFSPTVYADGGVFDSLGAVVIINLFINFVFLACYIMRRPYLRYVFGRKRKGALVANAMLLVGAIVAVCTYTFLVFRSIIMNSSVTLELYKLNDLSIYTAVVYFSLILLLMTVPLLVSVLMTIVRRLTGFYLSPATRRGRLFFSVCVALFFVLSSAFLGFKKERDRASVWVNMLSMDRDISLEIRLRSVENDIAADPIISSLIYLQNTDAIIMNRLSESHLPNASQDYDISTVIVDPYNSNNPAVIAYFNERIRGGVPIAEGSRFMYIRDNDGQAVYTGMFLYYNEDYGVTRLFVSVEPKSNLDGVGYANILGYSSSGRTHIPARYAYARYVSGKLSTSKGNVSYPTVLTDEFVRRMSEDNKFHYISEGYSHIISDVTEDEVVIISRPMIEKTNYFVAGFFIGLLTYLCSGLLVIGRHPRKRREKNYYKSRINAVLLVSLVVTLITLAGISVAFVYTRNDASLKATMSDRINSIQSLLQERVRHAVDFADLNSPELAGILDDIASSTRTDITLYTTSGRAFRSTNTEVFDRMILGSRIDEEAYDNIVYRHRKYYIVKDHFGKHHYHSLYAPVFNSSGKMMAIVCSPYCDESYDFETAAVMHSVSIFTVFIILLIIARIAVMKVVDRMFKPITEMSRKMNSAEIGNLQYIYYERNDEISTLVRAYNLMVHDLSNSTRQLAQTERDKAWSEMARQVAHEIKNPLTPMKLQLQRIISLKGRGNPVWVDRFDDAAKVILDHIDILTDTANEFSTFAKLYSEDPVIIDLDKMLKEEVDMFNTRENIDIAYFGLDSACISGPKPQLTRVIVNLMTNAIQAIEISQGETGTPEKGEIRVSLRNSVKDGFYDIVVEDNGPGVKDENRSKLFVPEFTTKNSGSGLGLAISRNIVEKCGGEIFYSKSFALQGACFTIRYPKNAQV